MILRTMMLKSPVQLLPVEGVELDGDAMVARSNAPWLRILDAETRFAGRWIRIGYRSSFFDDPVRPLVRFATAGGEDSLQTMSGPVLGSAESIVRVPDDVVAVYISPAARPGRFDFVIDRIETLPRASLVARGARREPLRTATSVGVKLLGFTPEAQTHLKFAISSTPLDRYDTWYRARSRPLDLDGIDRRRSDWQFAPFFRFITALEGDDASQLDATIKSLQKQAYSRWTMHALAGPRTGDTLRAAYRRKMREDERLAEIDGNTKLSELWPGDERIAAVAIGDRLLDYSLAVIAEAIARDPDAVLVYGDADAIASDGSLHSPVFKPDWSPAFQAATSYVGRSAFMRGRDVANLGCISAAELILAERETIESVLSRSERPKVVHIRRILYRRACEPAESAEPSNRKVAGTTTHAPALPQSWPEVAIIVPTRDRADLLSICLQGLRQSTDYPSFNVIVVDNGSVEPATLALLQSLKKDSRFAVLRYPQPFNYSAMCNCAASKAKCAVLVFLNNDIAMIGPDWLKPLVAWAVRPDVGAVGSKLLYPTGRIQHAGVVIGAGGRASHLYSRAPASDTGYMDQLTIAHEVAAVTGACMAVERSKFEAVNGFDAANLPVDLNDIDLCLRLSEQGWRTMWTPQSVLFHRESASRWRVLNPSKQYRRERSYFVQRWGPMIRDDPYFHPALSLYSHAPALG